MFHKVYRLLSGQLHTIRKYIDGYTRSSKNFKMGVRWTNRKRGDDRRTKAVSRIDTEGLGRRSPAFWYRGIGRVLENERKKIDLNGKD